MKIAIAQLNPTIGDLAGNARQILDAAQQAIAQDAALLLTTELSLCGYPPRDLLMQPSFLEAMAGTLEQLARDLPLQLAVLVGTVVPNENAAIAGGKPLFNSTALLQHGQIQQYFHKRLLPTYDVFDEDRYFEPGTETNWFYLGDRTTGLKVGVTICEDLWNDEAFWGKRTYPTNPLIDLAAQGVDVIVNLSASPYSVGKQAVREAMLRHSAANCQVPILYANQVGGNDDLLFDGSSFGLNRQGNVVFRAREFESDLTVVEFDKELGDVKPGAIAPAITQDDEEIWCALVMGVRDYVRKCGFSTVVLGLSGGIDSTLVAAIAAAAIGAENVLGVLMPSPYSSDHSITDALDLAKNLGIRTHTVPIQPMMEGFDQGLAPIFAGTEFGIAEENLQSRIRGTLLMAISNKFGHLLITTGNKSEMAVGYCTLYGDMNGGLGAIADVPKTRVYSLCRWLNEAMQFPNFALPDAFCLRAVATPVIPPHVISKPPSAELKPGQVDQDSLPAYEILDDILERFVERHESLADIIAAGHDAATVEKVVRLVTRAEFKRKQAPPGLKITDRAFGTGWRVPIASRWLPTVRV
ncbi:NAD+ synthase [Leptolyngbya sp. AN02str]|uniref:NAD+ synthase n=1 Tax=Leptolyngbya sp. AN02str TaxID=3423363 RepID=UPI003D310C56